MPNTDYPDFTQPVAVFEQDALILTGENQAPGTVTAAVDTSGLQSIAIAMNMPGGAAGARSALQVQWRAGGLNVSLDTVTFHSLASYVNAPFGMIWQLPVRGSSVAFTYISDSPSVLQYNVNGATRPLLKPTITYVANAQSRRRLDTGNQAIAAGGTAGPFYVPPSTGAVVIRSNASNSLNVVRANPVDFQGAAMTSAAPLCAVAPVGGVQPQLEIDAPGLGLEVTLLNTDTVAHTFSATIWDAS